MNKKRKTLINFISWALFSILTFELINRPTINTPTIIKIPFDDQIPVIEEFILIYQLFMPLLIIFGIYLYKKDKLETLEKYTKTLWLSQLSAYVIFFFFQTDIPRADLTLLKPSIFKTLMEITYKADNHYAGCPSLHVANITVFILTIFNTGIKNKFKIPLIILAILIAISTVFVKQHMILDLVYGIVHGALAYFIITKIQKRV